MESVKVIKSVKFMQSLGKKYCRVNGGSTRTKHRDRSTGGKDKMRSNTTVSNTVIIM